MKYILMSIGVAAAANAAVLHYGDPERIIKESTEVLCTAHEAHLSQLKAIEAELGWDVASNNAKEVCHANS